MIQVWDKYVCVEFIDDRIGLRTRETHRNLADESIQASLTPVFKRIEAKPKLSAGKGRKGEVKAHRYQFPLKPATARTFHSSQGTSMDAACMDLSNAKGKAGMHYTALSCVCTAESLYFQKSPSHAAKTAFDQGWDIGIRGTLHHHLRSGCHRNGTYANPMPIETLNGIAAGTK